jgi:hypothetical protein
MSEDTKIIFERDATSSAVAAEFKPGDKSYTQFGSETLNANVPWCEVLQEILIKGYSIGQLAKEVETTEQNLFNVLQENYQSLNFRTGARILSIHYRLHPES